MATARRVQLTPVSLHSALPHHCGTDLPPSPGLKCPPAPSCQAESSLSARIELLLFEPDDEHCAEFHYPELTALRVEGGGEAWSEALEENDGDELQALARTFQKKHRKERVQDLVDLGDGYDETDSFIDNSEAYDELVPTCLTTKYGGFYINVGTLQFRQASGEGHESDDFEENVQPKKRKLKEGGEVKTSKKKKRKEDVQPGGEITKHSAPSVDKRKKASKQQNLDGMLRKFHKEKLQELQLFNTKRKESPPAAEQVESVSADQISMLAAADDLHQALMEQDELSTNEQKQENREPGAETPQASLPEGLPPTLEGSLRELAQGIHDSAEGKKMEMFAPEINSILLDVSAQWKELPGEVCSAVFSYLSCLISCSKDALLRRARKLRLLQLDDQLAVLIRSLEETVMRVMPEQIERFNDHCQAHSEARAAKLEAVKEKRAAEGSDEEEDDSGGKRVFGPRKRFRWNEEIRELLCEVVRLKMSVYDLDAPSDQSLEDYLKWFLEASMKTLWPRGWMQSRILLIESRRVHAHITGVVARKKSMAVLKSEKCEEKMDVLPVPVNEAPSGAKSQKVPPACGGVSVPRRLPAEERKAENLSGVERDVYFPPSLLCRAVAATEGSCGDPALPTPSLSHQTSPLRSAPKSGALPSAAPLLASPAHDGTPADHTDVCRTSAHLENSSHDGSQIPRRRNERSEKTAVEERNERRKRTRRQNGVDYYPPDRAGL